MSIAWDDLSRSESVGNVLSDVVSGPSFSIFLLEFQDVVQTLLVGQSVKRACEAVQGS